MLLLLREELAKVAIKLHDHVLDEYLLDNLAEVFDLSCRECKCVGGGAHVVAGADRVGEVALQVCV